MPVDAASVNVTKPADLLRGLQQEIQLHEKPKEGLTSTVAFGDIATNLRKLLSSGTAGMIDFPDWRVDNKEHAAKTIATLRKVLPAGSDIATVLPAGLELAAIWQCAQQEGKPNPFANNPKKTQIAQKSLEHLQYIKEQLQARNKISAEKNLSTYELARGKEGMGAKIGKGISDTLRTVGVDITPQTGTMLLMGLAAYFTYRALFGKGADSSKGGLLPSVGTILGIASTLFIGNEVTRRALGDGRNFFDLAGDVFVGTAHAADDMTFDMLRETDFLTKLKEHGLGEFEAEQGVLMSQDFPDVLAAWRKGANTEEKTNGTIPRREMGLRRLNGLQDQELFQLTNALIIGWPRLLQQQGALSAREMQLVDSGQEDVLMERWYGDKPFGELWKDFILGHPPECRDRSVESQLAVEISPAQVDYMSAISDQLGQLGQLSGGEQRLHDYLRALTNERTSAQSGVTVDKATVDNIRELTVRLLAERSYLTRVANAAEGGALITAPFQAITIAGLNGASGSLITNLETLISQLAAKNYESTFQIPLEILSTSQVRELGKTIIPGILTADINLDKDTLKAVEAAFQPILIAAQVAQAPTLQKPPAPALKVGITRAQMEAFDIALAALRDSLPAGDALVDKDNAAIPADDPRRIKLDNFVGAAGSAHALVVHLLGGSPVEQTWVSQPTYCAACDVAAAQLAEGKEQGSADRFQNFLGADRPSSTPSAADAKAWAEQYLSFADIKTDTFIRRGASYELYLKHERGTFILHIDPTKELGYSRFQLQKLAPPSVPRPVPWEAKTGRFRPSEVVFATFIIDSITRAEWKRDTSAVLQSAVTSPSTPAKVETHNTVGSHKMKLAFYEKDGKQEQLENLIFTAGQEVTIVDKGGVTVRQNAIDIPNASLKQGAKTTITGIAVGLFEKGPNRVWGKVEGGYIPLTYANGEHLNVIPTESTSTKSAPTPAPTPAPFGQPRRLVPRQK